MKISEVIPIFVTRGIFNVFKQMLRFKTLSLKSFSQKTRLIFLFLFFTGFNQIHGQTHSFSGTIGKYPIYIEFTLDGSKVEGYYFYKNKLIDIGFSGAYKAGVITAKTTDGFGEVVENPEIFKFKWPNKTPIGTWTNKGKTSELKLLPLTAKETSSPKWDNSYLAQQMSDISNLKKVKIGLFKLKEDGQPRIINRVKVRYFTEVNSGLTFFRIDSGFVANKLNDMNSYLEFFHISEFLGSLDCGSYSSYGSDYNFDVSNITVSNDLICFSVFATFYCGGAHPDEVNFGMNYDLKTRSKINSEDYLISGKEEAFQQLVLAYFTKTYPGYFDPERPDDDMECEYNNPELWTTDCSFTFTDEGLKLHPSFAHYKAPCLDPEWAVVPYSELKELIKPEYYSKLVKLKP
jgi:hypothetical protein